jgi:hypothetical protein
MLYTMKVTIEKVEIIPYISPRPKKDIQDLYWSFVPDYSKASIVSSITLKLLKKKSNWDRS